VTTRTPGLGVLLVLASGALFAVNGTVSKLVLRAGIDAPQLTLLRAAGAFTGLLVLSLLVRPGARRLRVTAGQLPLLIGYGLAGFFLVPMLYFVAISRLPVGIALLFEYTAPLLVALWARFGQHQRVRPRLWAGWRSASPGWPVSPRSGVTSSWMVSAYSPAWPRPRSWPSTTCSARTAYASGTRCP
jgi:drug/metabolite transporter (DMT)-like permease